MTNTLARIAIAIAAAAVIGTAAPAAAEADGARDPITAVHRPAKGDFCIRSGWATASEAKGRIVRRGDCHDQGGWRVRGVRMDPTDIVGRPARPGTAVAAR